MKAMRMSFRAFISGMHSVSPEKYTRVSPNPRMYGYDAFTAENLEALAATIHTNWKIRQIFAGYYAASAPSPITIINWPFYCCAETHFTAADYSKLRMQLRARPGKERKVMGVP